jgi:hypothetical protein
VNEVLLRDVRTSISTPESRVNAIERWAEIEREFQRRPAQTTRFLTARSSTAEIPQLRHQGEAGHELGRNTDVVLERWRRVRAETMRLHAERAEISVSLLRQAIGGNEDTAGHESDVGHSVRGTGP